MPCFHSLRPLAAAALLAAGGAVVAQPATGRATLPPPQLVDAVPPASTPAGDPQPVPWAASNDLVRRLGGHAGHLRASASGPAASTPGSSPATPPKEAER